MKKKLLLPLIMALSLSTAQAKSTANNVMHFSTVDGKKIDMKITETGFDFTQFKGKSVLLDFFGPHCPPCLKEMPHLIELQKEHKKDLVILGVQVQKRMSNDELKDFMKRREINYPVINLDDAMELVQFIQTNTTWGGQIPYMLLFNKTGKLVETYTGLTDISRIKKDMRK